MSAAPTHHPADPAARRRAERLAAAEALLAGPPPLDDLTPLRARVLDAAVLRPSRSRPVVRWTVVVDEPGAAARPLRVIGKGYLRGGGAEAHGLLRTLRAAGLDGPALRVPRPFGFDPVRRLVTQEEAPSATLHDLVGEPGTALPAVARVGSWLACLHRAPVPGLPHLPADFEERALTSYAERLAEDVPAIGARVRDLVAQTLASLPSGGALVATHGDFQPKNVHLGDDTVVVIDFDRAAAAPAARDLGHFVAQALTMGAARHGSLDALRPWVGAFLEAYAGAGGSGGAVAATPAYVGRTFAEVLFYRLVVRPVPDRGFVPEWLDAWQRVLDTVEGQAA